MTGNRCDHDPKHPRLSPAKPIRKGRIAAYLVADRRASQGMVLPFKEVQAAPIPPTPENVFRTA